MPSSPKLTTTMSRFSGPDPRFSPPLAPHSNAVRCPAQSTTRERSDRRPELEPAPGPIVQRGRLAYSKATLLDRSAWRGRTFRLDGCIPRLRAEGLPELTSGRSPIRHFRLPCPRIAQLRQDRPGSSRMPGPRLRASAFPPLLALYGRAAADLPPTACVLARFHRRIVPGVHPCRATPKNQWVLPPIFFSSSAACRSISTAESSSPWFR